jgi:HK97 family phage major capsid protein
VKCADTPLEKEKGNTMNTQYQRYQNEADAITSQPMTPTSRARLQFLLSGMATMREFGFNESHSVSRDPLAFRKKFLSKEARTYVALSESSGAALIPSDLEVRLKMLMLANGPMFAGSPLLTNIFSKVMTPSKIAVVDDLSQPGIIASENVALTNDAELTGLSGITIGNNSARFSTGILLASVPLAEDVQSPESLEQIIVKAASPRLSRIENATFLSILKTALALNASAGIHAGAASITASNVYSLIASVGAAYRPSAAFIMSPAQQTAIGALITAGSSAREFPDVLSAKPTIRGYDVHVVAAAAASDILFGDFSYLYCKHNPLELRVLRERFIPDGNFYAYLLSERAEAKWTVAATSDSPVKYLIFP